MANKITCPNCGSMAIVTMGKGFWFILGLCTASICFWLGLIFFPFLIGIPVGFVLAIVGLFAKKSHKCNTCKYEWADEIKEKANA